MKITKKETIFEGRFLRVIAKHFQARDGKKGIWECIERKIPRKKAVVIFPMTKNKEVVLEKIYRIPMESYVLEPPAGLCDKKDETEEETARRELLEETGYRADKLIKVLKTTGNMALQDFEIVYFFAPDVELVGKTKTDDAEEIEVIKMPVDKLIETAINPPPGLKIAFDLLSVIPVLRKKNLI